jgi:hypothetical protein
MKRIMTIGACSLYVIAFGGASDNYKPTERGYYDDNGSFQAYSNSHPPPPETPAPPAPRPPNPFEPRSQNMRQDSHATPPARFDHRPDRVIEQVLSPEQIQKICAPRRVIFTHAHWGGCTFVRAGMCQVYLANTPRIEQVRRHEYAHCNGWSSNHEP